MKWEISMSTFVQISNSIDYLSAFHRQRLHQMKKSCVTNRNSMTQICHLYQDQYLRCIVISIKGLDWIDIAQTSLLHMEATSHTSDIYVLIQQRACTLDSHINYRRHTGRRHIGRCHACRRHACRHHARRCHAHRRHTRRHHTRRRHAHRRI